MCDNYTCVVPIGATTPEGLAKQKGQDWDRHFDTPQTSDVFRIMIFRRLSLKKHNLQLYVLRRERAHIKLEPLNSCSLRLQEFKAPILVLHIYIYE